MVRERVKVKKIVRDYIKAFPSDFKIEKIFLFGSYATGKTRKDSDIDLIVISSDFKRMNFLERLEFLSSLRKNYSTRNNSMDIFGYTPQEFKTIDKESVIMRRAKKEGVEIRV
jgi:predicted nucleotidyltransferase